MKKFVALTASVLMGLAVLSGCTAGTGSGKNVKISFADADWDSIKFHNAVAMYIAEKAFGYQTEEISGSTAITYQAILEGDIDAYMEVWTDNLATYKKDVEDKKLIELGVNFDDNNQGFYVPRYVIEGDASRNIKAMAPDLKTVEDLKKYKELFQDEEDKTKGRVYGAIPGWEVDKIMYKKYTYYGLDKDFVYFRPGSSAALAAAFTSAYEKGEPIVGYYWDPTWLTGKYDLVLLGDKPYDEAVYQDGKCEFPSVRVTVCASNKLAEKAPDFVEFLKKYKTSSALTAKALAYMQDNKADYKTTAKWFMKENSDLIKSWLGEEKANAVLDSLN